MSVLLQGIETSQTMLLSYCKGKMFVFVDVTLCSAVADCQHFGGTCHLHLQGKSVLMMVTLNVTVFCDICILVCNILF